MPRILIARKASAGGQPAGLHRLRESQPGKMQFGSAGIGSGTHLPACCSIWRWASMSPTCPIAGEAPAHAGSDRRPYRLHVPDHPDRRRAGASKAPVKGVAVMSAHRVKIIPDFADHRRAGPAGLSKPASGTRSSCRPARRAPIVAKLNKAMSDTLDDAGHPQTLEGLGSRSPRRSAARRNICKVRLSEIKSALGQGRARRRASAPE